MNFLDDISTALASRPVKGFLSHEEGCALSHAVLAKKSESPVVEIGSYCGLSTVYLAHAVKQTGQVLYAIDHHKGSEEHQLDEAFYDPDLIDQKGRVSSLASFLDTLERFDLLGSVIPVVAKAQLVATHWQTKLSLIFIDGGHSFEQAFADLTLWSNHLREGGVLLIHDIYDADSCEGQAPRLALQKFIDSSKGGWHSHRYYRSMFQVARSEGDFIEFSMAD